MAIFNSYVSLPEGISFFHPPILVDKDLAEFTTASEVCRRYFAPDQAPPELTRSFRRWCAVLTIFLATRNGKTWENPWKTHGKPMVTLKKWLKIVGAQVWEAHFLKMAIILDRCEFRGFFWADPDSQVFQSWEGKVQQKHFKSVFGQWRF